MRNEALRSAAKGVEIKHVNPDCQNMVRKHYLITGRVQGVGFRRFVMNQARSLNLRGWVRNLDDGRVEALAEGEVAELQKLERELHSGPPHSSVDSVVISDGGSCELGTAATFQTVPDGGHPCFFKP